MKNMILFFVCYLLYTVQLNAQPGIAVTNSKPEIIPISVTQTAPISFTHSSNSAMADSVIELKWDTTEPIGHLTGLIRSDTACVIFDGVPGGVLDSVKIALQSAGTVTGGVWQFTHKFTPTPLGKPLAVPINATITTASAYPYPVPYKNWATVDLRQMNIKTDSSFAVAFAVGQDSVIPGFMVSHIPSKTAYHSYTYYGPKHGLSTGWYYLTGGKDSIYIYLIRAYVTVQPATAVRDVKQNINNFELAQNYPNPFNPETVIKYSLSQEGQVSIKVFNLLGETVAELVNKVQQTGNYSVNFRPSNTALSSGIYFYSIEVNSLNGSRLFSSVRKMAYIK